MIEPGVDYVRLRTPQRAPQPDYAAYIDPTAPKSKRLDRRHSRTKEWLVREHGYDRMIKLIRLRLDEIDEEPFRTALVQRRDNVQDFRFHDPVQPPRPAVRPSNAHCKQVVLDET